MKLKFTTALMIAGSLWLNSCSKPYPGSTTENTDAADPEIRGITPGEKLCGPQVITFAGRDSKGYLDGKALSSLFNNPADVAYDIYGRVFVADMENNVIRMITRDGIVSTFAGNGMAGSANGLGLAAQFNQPSGIITDALGNIFVADKSNHIIRKISAAGDVTTIAGIPGVQGFTDGPANVAKFSSPSGLDLDINGNLIVADAGNNRIRKISRTGLVSTLAGNGTVGTADGLGFVAQFSGPADVAVDSSNTIYVSDAGNNKIRKIASGTVTTVAGGGISRTQEGFADGIGTAALFRSPAKIDTDFNGNVIVADRLNHAIRRVSSAGQVATILGNGLPGHVDGELFSARFNLPTGIFVAGINIYIAEQGSHYIRLKTIIECNDFPPDPSF